MGSHKNKIGAALPAQFHTLKQHRSPRYAKFLGKSLETRLARQEKKEKENRASAASLVQVDPSGTIPSETNIRKFNFNDMVLRDFPRLGTEVTFKYGYEGLVKGQLVGVFESGFKNISFEIRIDGHNTRKYSVLDESLNKATLEWLVEPVKAT